MYIYKIKNILLHNNQKKITHTALIRELRII